MRAMSDAQIAAHSSRFFKTGKGEYGEGDRFLGIRVPKIRGVARRFRSASLQTTERLLASPYHEERLLAVIILVEKFRQGGETEREAIHRLYTLNLHRINGWDIVDISAPAIIGGFLELRDRSPLYEWARSSIMWERRISIMATFHFIRQRDFSDALAITEILLHDNEDLIHKAVGWMLREIGNRDRAVEENYLKIHAGAMPRTMLRYAIEKFSPPLRNAYLIGRR